MEGGSEYAWLKDGNVPDGWAGVERATAEVEAGRRGGGDA